MPRSVASTATSSNLSQAHSVNRLAGFRQTKYANPPERKVIGLTHNYQASSTGSRGGRRDAGELIPARRRALPQRESIRHDREYRDRDYDRDLRDGHRDLRDGHRDYQDRDYHHRDVNRADQLNRADHLNRADRVERVHGGRIHAPPPRHAGPPHHAPHHAAHRAPHRGHHGPGLWEPEEFEHVEHHDHEELIPVRVHERTVHRTREVPVPHLVPEYIEVDRPYPVEKIVEVPKIVERRIEVPVEVERPVEVPVPYPVEVIRRVEVPVPVERVVEKIVEVDRPVAEHFRVEVPVREERIRSVEVPVREQVPVPTADPRLSHALTELQGELHTAYTEIDRLRGGRGSHVHRTVDRIDHGTRRRAHSIDVFPGGVDHPDLFGAHDVHHGRAFQPPRGAHLPPHRHGRGLHVDPLLHEHPTAKFGNIHDIPNKRSYPNDPYYRLHPQAR